MNHWRMIDGLITILDGMVMILTLGNVYPMWSLKYCKWELKHKQQRLYASGN